MTDKNITAASQSEEIFWSDKLFELEPYEMIKLLRSLPEPQKLPAEQRIPISSDVESIQRVCMRAEPTEGTRRYARTKEYRFRRDGITTYFSDLWRYLRSTEITQIPSMVEEGTNWKDFFDALQSKGLLQLFVVPESRFKRPIPITDRIREVKYDEREDYSLIQSRKAFYALMTFFERTMERDLAAGISEEERKDRQRSMCDSWQAICDGDEKNYPAIFQRLMCIDNPYEDREFLESILSPELKTYAEGLTKDDFPLVIDCGHVDSPSFVPDFTDFRTFEDGVLLMKYLNSIGHDDVKIGILFNEMPMLDIAGNTIARRDIRKLRQDVKNKGMHFFAEIVYGNILRNLLVPVDEWKDMFVHTFEGSAILQCRQDMEAYRTGKNPFKVDHITFGDDGRASYDMPTDSVAEVKDSCSVGLTTPRGAPNCNFLSAKINSRYQDQGNGAVLYLRDVKWECKVKQGVNTARKLYGVTIPIYMASYAFRNSKDGMERSRARVENINFLSYR